MCPKCNHIKHVPFTCKSRFCNTCGAKYSEDRALNMSAKLLDNEHRHVVFTIAEELRPYFAHDRSLLHCLFEAVADTLFFSFGKRNKAENYTPGFICVLHTFGRDLKWNTHIHVILCTSAVSRYGKWKNFNHINYEGLRKSWQFCLLRLMNSKIQTPEFKCLVDKLYASYNNGFYVNAPPIKRFSAGVVNYILRYAGRPVLAQSRIKNYDGKTVTFTYTPHGSDELVTETVPVFDFIKRLIIHIPDRNFKIIRYFGFYARSHKMHRAYMLRRKKIDSAYLALRKRTLKSWRKRIITSFSHDPLKCSCWAHYELIEIFYPLPYKPKFFSLPDTS